MPRPSNGNGFSVAQLEKMLAKSRSRIGSLERKRSKFLRQLDALDAQIALLGGASRGGSGRGSRPKNKTTLTESIVTILKKSASPMKVSEIARRALDSGYASNSSNFRVIVNQALIKDKRFAKAGLRGTYQLKK